MLTADEVDVLRLFTLDVAFRDGLDCFRSWIDVAISTQAEMEKTCNIGDGTVFSPTL
jgi:hypothetical protein